MYFSKKILLVISGFAFISFLVFFPNLASAVNIDSFLGFDTSSPQGYINSIYRYGISLIAILATAGIVYGGFRYLTSAGNEEAATSGKGAIFAALSGLVIALLSHMILQQLDPRLVELRLTVPEVGQQGSCDSNNDCTGDDVCNRGVCEPPRGSNADPDSSTDCDPSAPEQDRETCEGRNGTGSRCYDPPGTPGPVCTDTQLGQNGRGCREIDGDCEGDLDCIRAASRQLCTDHQVGSPCNDDCAEGVCLNNICVADDAGPMSRDDGTECEEATDCISGICIRGGDGLSRCQNGTSNSCRDDNDCFPTHYCNMVGSFGHGSRTCRIDFTEADAPCERDSQCFSGSCTEETCEGEEEIAPEDVEWE